MSEKKTLNFERIDASELDLVQGGYVKLDSSKGGTDLGGPSSGGMAGYQYCYCCCACAS